MQKVETACNHCLTKYSSDRHEVGTLLDHVLLMNFMLIVFCMNINKGK